MLPRKNRLVKKEDFKEVYLKGKTHSFKREGLILKYAKNNLKQTRIGFVVGKNYSKKTTERNKAKRLLREAFYENMEKIKPGFDVIVLFRKGRQKTQPVKYATLAKQAKEALKENKLLKK